MDKSNQWELSGDCSLCRRKKYCSKPCKRNKRSTQAMIHSLVANKLNEMTGGAYSELEDRLADWRVRG